MLRHIALEDVYCKCYAYTDHPLPTIAVSPSRDKDQVKTEGGNSRPLPPPDNVENHTT